MDYMANDLDKSEAEIFELVQDFSNFNFWKIKGFILLSDVYLARKDYFQARTTLQSVIDNVKEQPLLDEARTKMAALDAAENQNIAKGDTIASPDTLDYEGDYKNLIDENKSPKK